MGYKVAPASAMLKELVVRVAAAVDRQDDGADLRQQPEPAQLGARARSAVPSERAGPGGSVGARADGRLRS